MGLHSWLHTRVGKGIALVLGLAAAAALVGALAGGPGSPAAAAVHPKIEASIFSYDDRFYSDSDHAGKREGKVGRQHQAGSRESRV